MIVVCQVRSQKELVAIQREKRWHSVIDRVSDDKRTVAKVTRTSEEPGMKRSILPKPCAHSKHVALHASVFNIQGTCKLARPKGCF